MNKLTNWLRISTESPPMPTTLLRTTHDHSLGHQIDRKLARRLTAQAQALRAARGGHRMAIYANDLIGIQINQFGLYERDALELLFQFLEPLKEVFAQGTALDIGANIGNHTLFFAQRFARVHAFEPHPTTAELLRLNTQWVGHVSVYAHGLGDVRGQFDLIEHAANLGGSSIRIGDSTGGQVLPIAVERLDDLALDLQGLCFIKIDVEGFEAQVLRGSKATLAERQPLVVLEQHESEFTEGSTESIRFLSSLGYRFCWHQEPPMARWWLLRRLHELREAMFGREHRIETATVVPRQNYSMLIAVPPRFAAALGLR